MYETKISELNYEITQMKVDLIEKDNRIEELENILHQNNIALPEEKIVLEQKQEEILQKQVVRWFSLIFVAFRWFSLISCVGGGGEGGSHKSSVFEMDG